MSNKELEKEEEVEVVEKEYEVEEGDEEENMERDQPQVQVSDKAPFPSSPPTYVPLVPYPRWLGEKKLSDKFTTFLNVMKSLQINILFLKAMSQMAAYAKFLKEILSYKWKLKDELITFPYQVSALKQRAMPKNQRDPGSFTLPVKIGDLEPKGALADLGASVSLMPLSIAKHLNFPLNPMWKMIQLADHTLRVPHGEWEDVPIQVGHAFVPCDFVVMDMEEDSKTPLILGREALKTLGVVINCRNDTITVKVANERVVFEFSKTLKRPMIERICRVSLVENEIEDVALRVWFTLGMSCMLLLRKPRVWTWKR
ncbi:uncharacterized protein LOC125491894 [Beta vulgaris subsp. vulgaris]|uniref:uncharacterized protein LOC125491894 n=1 Tax=Beta vulgaris subsp. vulgaris TaxID=3555 RepID=UPI0020372D9A|nr:uncharacterized protein LOC125491894 [Beta vulgaris subsp. vulgaris]